MPELPEVEAARNTAATHCLSANITRVCALEQGGGPRSGSFDDIVIGEGVTAAQLTAALTGRVLQAVRRKGKHMWFELSGGGPQAVFHFGMTGALVVNGVAPLKYQEFKVDLEFPPKFCKLELQFSNGARLAFADPRRLGRIYLRRSPLTQKPVSALAPDPVTDLPDLASFETALAATAMPIKAALLDQQRAVCGVGNWVADETLHAAAVHPACLCNRLAKEQVAAIYTAARDVCATACAVDADSTRFPVEWLFHTR